MGFVDYRRDIEDPAVSADLIINRYYHSGQSFAFIGAPPGLEASLKMEVSAKLEGTFGISVHPLQIVICGSAHLGFRPVPQDRFGVSFDPSRSDLDLAIVSPELFESCWKDLQQAKLASKVREDVSEELFWGLINPARINTATTFGRKWWTLFGGMRTDRANGIRGRLYKNMWCMQNYHLLAVSRAISLYRRSAPAAGASGSQG